MSAMSASSPPSGLMPLSLIAEHKTSVQGVQSHQRTPEKMYQSQQPQNAQVAQPIGVKLPPNVANGMEPGPPAPAPYPQQDTTYPSANTETSSVALPPLSQHPNLPSGGKGENISSSGTDNAIVPEGSSSNPAGDGPPVAVEVPLSDIRLTLAPGLTITAIGVPSSQPSLPVVVPPSVAPIEPAQPSSTHAASIASTPSGSVTEDVGGANIAVHPVENQEVKTGSPEVLVDKPAAIPTETINSKSTPQAATPAPSSLVPPLTIKNTAQASSPAIKLAANAEPVLPATVQRTPSPAPTSLLTAPKPTPPPVSPKEHKYLSKDHKTPPKDRKSPLLTAAAAPPDVTPAPAGSSAPVSVPEPQGSSVPQTPTSAESEEQVASVPSKKPRRTLKTKSAGNNDALQASGKEPSTPSDKDGDGKPRRKRLPTQPYQSPIPELNLIAKINKIDKTSLKAQEDRLIVFYRNEFLAVRNAEGSYYVCQAMQNIYKSSSRIKIRWLSQDPNGGNYTPDFYDHTEFDCILTNLNLQRVGKDQFKLPDVEAKRTDSILKRAIDVEKGIVVADESTITEEHPDGLDLSLYRDEEQLKKRKKKSKTSHKDTKTEAIKTESRPTRLNKRRKIVKTEQLKRVLSRSKEAVTKKKSTSTATSSASGTTTKRGVPTPSVTKKPAASASTASASSTPTTPPSTQNKKDSAKKETTAVKRKAATATPASAPSNDKRSKRDPTSKTKSATVAVNPSTGSSSVAKTPTTSSASMSRRPTRNSK